MKLAEIGGALAPIPVTGVDDLYIRADFTWDMLRGFDPNNVTDREYPANLLTAMVAAEVLLFGDDHKVVTDSEVKANPPLVVGRIAASVMNTFVLYGLSRPDPKSSTAKTPTSRRRGGAQ